MARINRTHADVSLASAWWRARSESIRMFRIQRVRATHVSYLYVCELVAVHNTNSMTSFVTDRVLRPRVSHGSEVETEAKRTRRAGMNRTHAAVSLVSACLRARRGSARALRTLRVRAARVSYLSWRCGASLNSRDDQPQRC